jgi:hypothetical protein
MFISSINSTAQVISGERLNKKPPLGSSRIVSPILISKAARVRRARLRLQSRLDCLTIANLIAFAYQTNRTLCELEKMPMRDGYVTGKHYGRTYHSSPANWFYTKTEYCLYRLSTLLNLHRAYLSPQAAIAIEQALEWHRAKCRVMWEAKEGLALLACH